MSLLLVEDHSELRAMLGAYLRERGFEVVCAASGGEALASLEKGGFDAVILDLGLPDMNGMDVLRAIRTRGLIPTLILTARDAVEHRVAGLNEGADDYILKPFDLAEFEARLRAVLRRPGARDAPVASFAGLGLDTAARCASVGERHVDLTRREATLLEALIRSGERIVVRDVLEDALFGVDGDVSANALEATVSRLRRKIAQLDVAVRVESLRGVGYRLKRGDAGGA